MFTLRVDQALITKISKGDFYVVDLEADGLDDYTRIWCLSVGRPMKGVTTYVGDDVERGLQFLEDKLIVGHNFLKYDLDVIQNLYPETKITSNQIIDTLVLSRLDYPARPGLHALEAWGERVGIEKVEHEDWSQFSEDMKRRCETDVRITLKVFAKLGKLMKEMPLACEIEHAVAYQTRQCEKTGFCFNAKKAQADAAAFERRQSEVLSAIQAMWPPRLVKAKEVVKTYKVKPNKHSPLYGLIDAGVPFCPVSVEVFTGSREQAIDRLIQTRGWKPKKQTDSGGYALDEEVLANLPSTWPEVKLLEEYYDLESKLGFLKSRETKKRKTGWLDVVKDDGRIHPSINFCRAYTHRMSASNPNLQNVHKELRDYWEAPEGWTLVGADASGLELRCLCHYMTPYDGGRWAKEAVSGDIHTLNQNALGAYVRDTAKRIIYAMPYGAGDAKLGEIWYIDAHTAQQPPRYDVLGIAPTKSSVAIGRAIKGLPIFGNFEKLKKSAQQVVSQYGFILMPDGRKIRLEPKNNYSVIASLCQSLGAVVVKCAIALMPGLFHEKGLKYGRDYQFVVDVHDEIQMYVKPEHVETVEATAITAFRMTTDVLRLSVQMDGETKHGKTWAETH